MQIEDCPLNIELSAEKAVPPPPMLPHAALRADVKADCVDARLTSTLAHFTIATPTRETQSAGAEDVLVMVTALLV